jgi:hypothetical protein
VESTHARLPWPSPAVSYDRNGVLNNAGANNDFADCFLIGYSAIDRPVFKLILAPLDGRLLKENRASRSHSATS